MSILKESIYQDYLFKVGIITLVAASILSATGNAAVAILVSMIVGFALPIIRWWKQLKFSTLNKYSMTTKIAISIIPALVFSQFGWLAKLV